MDGLHLATALVGGLKEIVASDQRMKAAAKLLGLSIPL